MKYGRCCDTGACQSTCELACYNLMCKAFKTCFVKFTRSTDCVIDLVIAGVNFGDMSFNEFISVNVHACTHACMRWRCFHSFCYWII